jgi:mycothiol synthase
MTALFPSPTLPPPGVTLRQIRVPDDYVAMNAIANAAREAGGEDWATSDEQFIAFYSHLVNCDLDTDVLVAVRAERAERAGRLIAYGRVSWRDDLEGARQYELVTFQEPAESSDLQAAMTDALEDRARAMAIAENEPRERVLIIPNPGNRAGFLAERGYLPVRFFYKMVRSNLDDLPDAPLPDGLEIRPVEPDHLRAIFDAETEAFVDHWGSTVQTDDDFEQFVDEAKSGGTGFWRVAWDGDQVAGMVRGYISEHENERYGRKRGYVEHISVRRPWRRRGLARALIGATITALREAGMTEGALGVDAENESGALRLYRACGFEVMAESALYRKPLAV